MSFGLLACSKGDNLRIVSPKDCRPLDAVENAKNFVRSGKQVRVEMTRDGQPFASFIFHSDTRLEYADITGSSRDESYFVDGLIIEGPFAGVVNGENLPKYYSHPAKSSDVLQYFSNLENMAKAACETEHSFVSKGSLATFHYATSVLDERIEQSVGIDLSGGPFEDSIPKASEICGSDGAGKVDGESIQKCPEGVRQATIQPS